MEAELRAKISKIEDILNDRCILKATPDFDKVYPEANIVGDPRGARWNPYVHNHCCEYGFEIWKDSRGHNYYVKATDRCKAEARRQGLIPHTVCP